METNVNYTIVGLFVISILTMITLAIIWLSAGLSLHPYSTYEVYMTESVSGLGLDAPVEYNGVDVGTVKSIELNRKNPRIVELLLSIRSDTPITQATRATLTTRGLTGVAYLALKDQGTDLTPLKPYPGQRYPVISTAPSIFMRLDTALERLSHNVHEVTQSIQSLLDEENLRSIKQILLNVQTITGTLSVNSKEMSTILQNTSKASEQFTPLLQSSTATMQILQTQTLPAASQAMSNLANATQNLSQISNELKQNPAMLIRGKEPNTLGPGEK